MFIGNRWVDFLASSAVIVGIALLAVLYISVREQSRLAISPRPSEFSNAVTDVKFVGAERCAACHEPQYQSFQQTAHHLAFGPVEQPTSLPAGEFSDPVMHRNYRVYWQDGQMRHAETLLQPDGDPLLVIDHAMKYVVGSGRYSQSYLIEQDGSLFESPATWYSETQSWGLSPGYEHSNSGFQRPIEYRCLQCHVGRIASLENSPQKMAFLTAAIDCERCHGPGELHAARWENPASKAESMGWSDLTIVHPGRLDRRRGEDICMQCHLHSAATVERPGRQSAEFRPGDRLEDYVTHFGRRNAGQQMDVTGHGEQMRLSRCYTESETFTCTTCHNPHASVPEEERESWYRSRCLECHAEQSCHLPTKERLQISPSDYCVTCHMPRGPTEIPHFAFTHHRVGIHTADASQETPTTSLHQLAAMDEPEDVSEDERQRNLGLAYLQYSDTAEGQPFRRQYQQQAQALLMSLSRRDAEVAAALARLSFGQDARLTLKMADEIDTATNASPDARATALFTRGATLFQQGQTAAAIPWLERAVDAKPMADIWLMLSNCYQQQGDSDRALSAVRKAVQLAPMNPRCRERCSELEFQFGEPSDPDAARMIQELRAYWDRVSGR
ncbi:tetratricopeptide repeat protein [bacterium]|nr:tetratricopeptide repeat protein [bacterium]